MTNGRRGWRHVRHRYGAAAGAPAREKSYKAPDVLPETLKNLTYDPYRMIRFIAEKALWPAENLPFQAQFFHRGYDNGVDIFQMDQGKRQERSNPPFAKSFFVRGGPPPDPC